MNDTTQAAFVRVPVNFDDVFLWLSNERKQRTGDDISKDNAEAAWRELLAGNWYDVGQHIAFLWDFAWDRDVYDPLSNCDHCEFHDVNLVRELSFDAFCEHVSAGTIKFVPTGRISGERYGPMLVVEAAEYAIARCGGKNDTASQVMRSAVHRSLLGLPMFAFPQTVRPEKQSKVPMWVIGGALSLGLVATGALVWGAHLAAGVCLLLVCITAIAMYWRGRRCFTVEHQERAFEEQRARLSNAIAEAVRLPVTVPTESPGASDKERPA